MFTFDRNRRWSISKFPPFRGFVSEVGSYVIPAATEHEPERTVYWFAVPTGSALEGDFYVEHNGRLSVKVDDYISVEFDHLGNVTSIAVNGRYIHLKGTP